jgi:hypothetical protein
VSAWDNSPWRVGEVIDALLENDLIFDLGDRIPTTPREHGGRPRHYPNFAFIFYAALVSVFRSSRRAEAELSNGDTWERICRKVKLRFPAEPDMWLPERPIARHHYEYMRNTYLLDDGTWNEIAACFRLGAAEQAMRIGLCRTDGPGSLTHPS